MILGWMIFYNPANLPAGMILWLLLPMVLAVSLVYRTIKTPDVNMIWIKTFKTFAFLTLGMAAFGVAIYLLQVFALRCL